MLLRLLVAANIALPSSVALADDPGFTRCLDRRRWIHDTLEALRRKGDPTRR